MQNRRGGVANPRLLWVLATGAAVITLIPAVALSGGRQRGQTQIGSFSEDFFLPGTQPEPNALEFSPILQAQECQSCHGTYPTMTAPYNQPWDGWVNSIMGQAARDPVWHAALTIANQDASVAGEFCIRCHSPSAFMSERHVGGTTANFVGADWEGVTCHFCHRLVNPVLGKNSPFEDEAILNDLTFPPMHPGNAQYVLDPDDVRRGPFDDVPANMHGVPIIVSPFHQGSSLCATCHDVSNPIYTYDKKTGRYALTAMNAGHPTQDPKDMMPEQRTYSEWANSQFATTGVQFNDGRFGGNHPTGLMKSCQDCHMPDQFDGGCFAWGFPPFFPRENLPFHGFNGANTWVLGAVYEVHGEAVGISPASVDAARSRTVDMLRAASDLEIVQFGSNVKIRVVNWSGHKLPTGYPEGRRLWINAKFYGPGNVLIQENGGYDFGTASLTTNNTKVYEVKFGMDKQVAAATGLSAGESFHLVLNNYVSSDNRIPPIGFTNAAFDNVNAKPVNYIYQDGEHWDDTLFAIPPGATKVIATLYYQTSSREYMEFLRDTNVTDSTGLDAYNLWVSQGKSAPVDMDMMELRFRDPAILGDIVSDGNVNIFDLFALLGAWNNCPGPSICTSDLNCDGVVNVFDLFILLGNWTN